MPTIRAITVLLNNSLMPLVNTLYTGIFEQCLGQKELEFKIEVQLFQKKWW